MKYYLAPLEGITTYIYRRAYHTHYRPMEKYFTPFLVPHTKKDFNTREKNDILPEHNPDMYLVPQILANDAKGFLDTVEKLKMYGYGFFCSIRLTRSGDTSDQIFAPICKSTLLHRHPLISRKYAKNIPRSPA